MTYMKLKLEYLKILGKEVALVMLLQFHLGSIPIVLYVLAGHSTWDQDHHSNHIRKIVPLCLNGENLKADRKVNNH